MGEVVDPAEERRSAQFDRRREDVEKRPEDRHLNQQREAAGHAAERVDALRACRAPWSRHSSSRGLQASLLFLYLAWMAFSFGWTRCMSPATLRILTIENWFSGNRQDAKAERQQDDRDAVVGDPVVVHEAEGQEDRLRADVDRLVARETRPPSRGRDRATTAARSSSVPRTAALSRRGSRSRSPAPTRDRRERSSRSSLSALCGNGAIVTAPRGAAGMQERGEVLVLEPRPLEPRRFGNRRSSCRSSAWRSGSPSVPSYTSAWPL